MSVVVLAGGQSRRFGQDKALLEIDGQPLISRIVDKLSVLSDDLLIVTNDPDHYECLARSIRLVPDEQPGAGALMGVYSGLRASRHPHALCVACDMPFLNVDLLAYLVGLAEGYDVVVPRMGDYLEPLHAVYAKACLPAMRRLLTANRRQIVAFFPDVRVRYVDADEINRLDPDHLSFVNVNTPQDWVRARTRLGA